MQLNSDCTFWWGLTGSGVQAGKVAGKHCSYGHVAGTIYKVDKMIENTVCGHVTLGFFSMC